jgi:pimeloyl-ACP methyl ester carboxylesterase
VRTFTRDGLTFDVHEAGPPDGVPVVLLHGFPQDATCFAEVARRLAARGLRTLAPDQRGYSPGARPADRRAYGARELVADVAALLDAAGVDAAHVVGHDWGAGVAWAFAARHPERTVSLTALSSPHPRAVSRAAWRSVQAVRSAYMAVFGLPRLPERLLLADDGARLREALVRTGLPSERAAYDTARMLEPGALSAALAWYRAIPGGGWSELPAVRVPTVLVHGRDDPFIADASVRATRAWVRAPLVTIPVEGGHWLPERHPGTVTAAVVAQLDHAAGQDS